MIIYIFFIKDSYYLNIQSEHKKYFRIKNINYF
jgi:hypothetical protein